MAIVAATKPHPIFLAGRWVESPDVLDVDNPADPTTRRARPTTPRPSSTRRPSRPRSRAFEVTRKLPAYERGRSCARSAPASGSGARSSAGSSPSRRASRSATRWSRSTGRR